MITRENLIDFITENETLCKKLEYFTDEQKIQIVENFLAETQNALNEISLGGIKNVANLGVDKLRSAAETGLEKLGNIELGVRDKISNVKNSIESSIKDVKDAYYTGNIQELETKLLEIVVQSVNKINEKRKKMGQPPINPQSVLTSISNKALKMFK